MNITGSFGIPLFRSMNVSMSIWHAVSSNTGALTIAHPDSDEEWSTITPNSGGNIYKYDRISLDASRNWTGVIFILAKLINKVYYSKSLPRGIFMIKTVLDIPNETQDKIYDYYNNNVDIDLIKKKFNLSRNEILAVLECKNVNFVDKNLLTDYSLNENNYLIIADTHIGSRNENLKYLDLVYNYASFYKIKSIIHLGDLFQSSVRGVKSKCVDSLAQLDYVKENYPYDKNINNYILLGNHDFHLLSKDDNYLDYLSERNDFKILGIKHSYILLQNNIFSLYHDVLKYHFMLPNITVNLRFIGHRHELKANQEKVFVPTLSDDIKNYNSKMINLPGFLKLELTDEKLSLYHYPILNNNVLNNNLVLKKKLLKK